MFYYCINLKSINIPNSVTKIGNSAFYKCISLRKVIVNDIAAWCNISFYDSYSNPLSYAHHLYSDENTEITNLIIPEGVPSISSRAFNYCSITSVSIPNSVTSIGEQAFGECSSLETVVIGDGVSTIKQGTFQDCNKIKSITLGSNVSKIYEDNFYNCEDLEVVTCKAKSVPSLLRSSSSSQSNTFQKCYIEYAKLIVPDESIDAYKAADVWKDFGTIEGLSGYISETEKCATPTIHYANGQLTFECETEGVTFNTSITTPDAASYNSNTINLTGTYHVKVYATKPGFDNSDTATLEINLLEGSGPAIKGDVNGDGLVNISDVTDIINIILGK